MKVEISRWEEPASREYKRTGSRTTMTIIIWREKNHDSRSNRTKQNAEAIQLLAGACLATSYNELRQLFAIHFLATEWYGATNVRPCLIKTGQLEQNAARFGTGFLRKRCGWIEPCRRLIRFGTRRNFFFILKRATINGRVWKGLGTSKGISGNVYRPFVAFVVLRKRRTPLLLLSLRFFIYVPKRIVKEVQRWFTAKPSPYASA